MASHEVADRERRRFERQRAEAKLPRSKTIENFDLTLVPAVSKARVGVLASGDIWLEEGANVLLFGPLGTGKSHLAAGIGLKLVENGFRVLCQRTASLVQKLQAARGDLALAAAIGKLYKYHLLILDDFSYVTCEGAETIRGRTGRFRAMWVEKGPRIPPAQAPEQASPYLYPSENPTLRRPVPSRYARRAGAADDP